MLDGEKRVCLASESITVREQIDAYVWNLTMTCDMTPGRDLKDIKIIFADGIVIGETILDKLGISDTCKVLLDQTHCWPTGPCSEMI